MMKILLRHPAPPANLQPLIEIELIDREHDVSPCQHTEEQQLRDESVPIALLQCVVKTVVPLIEHDVDGHDREFDGNHGREENAAGPAVVGEEIWAGKPEDNGERRSEA